MLKITEALALVVALVGRIQAALLTHGDAIEVDDLGLRATDVDARVQAARGDDQA